MVTPFKDKVFLQSNMKSIDKSTENGANYMNMYFMGEKQTNPKGPKTLFIE